MATTQTATHPNSQQQNSPGAAWKIYTMSDAYKPRPPVEYLIENVFELPSLNMVYGAPSSLKSFVLADMVACIASGKDWLNPGPSSMKTKPKKVTQANVLWVDFDNGLRRTHERFDMLGKGHNIPETCPIFYTSMANPPLMMNNSASVANLSLLIKILDTKLVVIDNLGTVCGPGVDENSADMVQVMFNFRQIVESTGAAIIVIHHQRKANGFKTRVGETLRGHSSIEAALDLALIIERESGSKEIKLYSTKSRGIDVKPFGATFECHKDISGADVAQFYGFFIEDTNSDDAIKQAILDVTSANSPGISQKDLIEEVKNSLDNPGHNRIRKLIQTLVVEGKLDSITGKNNRCTYIVP